MKFTAKFLKHALRTYQWYENGKPTHKMTIEPLTQEIFDRYVKHMTSANPSDIHCKSPVEDVGRLHRKGFTEAAFIHQNIKGVDKKFYYMMGGTGFLPSADGLLSYKQIPNEEVTKISAFSNEEGEEGLLFRSDGEKMHDYDPHWDYEVDENPNPKLAQLATDVSKGIYARLKANGTIDKWMFGFEVWAASLPVGTVATYISGTYDFPVILIDLNMHEGEYEDQIGVSISHELKHAEQESADEEFDEDEAEEHGRGF